MLVDCECISNALNLQDRIFFQFLKKSYSLSIHFRFNQSHHLNPHEILLLMMCTMLQVAILAKQVILILVCIVNRSPCVGQMRSNEMFIVRKVRNQDMTSKQCKSAKFACCTLNEVYDCFQRYCRKPSGSGPVWIDFHIKQPVLSTNGKFIIKKVSSWVVYLYFHYTTVYLGPVHLV